MNRAPLPPRKTRVRSRSRTKRPPPGKDERLRAFVRGLRCLVFDIAVQRGDMLAGCDSVGDRIRIEPAHVKPWGSSRIDLDNVVPLCPFHHDMQEGRTEEFEREFSIDLIAAAREVTRRYRETKAA